MPEFKQIEHALLKAFSHYTDEVFQYFQKEDRANTLQ